MSDTYTINGYSLYSVLTNSQQLLNQKIFQKAMHDSGLARFADLSALLVPTKMATSQEVADFWYSIYNQVPPTTFKLLQFNVGDRMATAMQQFEAIHAVREKFLALPKEQRLGEAIAYMVTSGPMNFESYQQGYLLYFHDCPFFCRNLQVNESVCLLYEHMYLKMLKWFTDLTLTAKEINCCAVGDNRCAYYFHSL